MIREIQKKKTLIQAFSMVELLVITILLSVLTLMALRMFDSNDSAKLAKARLEMRQIADACAEFNSKKGYFPKEMKELINVGFYKNTPRTPFGNDYYLDGNFVCCSLDSADSAKSGDSGAVIRLIYNRIFIEDEFEDQTVTSRVWTINPAGGIDFDNTENMERQGGKYVKSDTALVSKSKFSGGTVTLKGIIPKKDDKGDRINSKIALSWGTNVSLSWENIVNKPYAKITLGSTEYTDRKFTGSENPVTFKIVTSANAGSKGKTMNIRYYIDNMQVPLNLNGTTVTVTAQPLTVTLKKGVFIDSVSASMGE